ncbi:conserved hypothetical protein [Desulfosarcina cetonica]|uniref:DNA-binding protein n=1 Tax=Desulfosarcina cetonica TaxID=90730 RepID=UPI000ABD59A4|nr:DNA-binding protein [Desulfosarcina cetonica]VTR64418.1 conserved hypothetical protein [Desulfosarcina cetonica]
MNENIIIKLSDFVGDSAFGNKEGREVYQKLLDRLDAHPDKKIIGISLAGITRTDASFPRESVISLVKSRNGEKGFYLQDFASRDLMDNWDYAAKAKGLTMIVIVDDGYELIGVDITPSAKELLDFAMKHRTVTTSMISSEFDISAQNASAKLKKLSSVGLVLATKQTAETGGMEFVYTAIQKI